MNNLVLGGFAISTAGHDLGKLYVIFHIANEYVYLVDGRIRTLNRPKKKKIKHINLHNHFDGSLAEQIKCKSVRNEDIKRALKLLQNGNSEKEVE
jgi:ribosomal protein L14E/L6E/L27E